MPHEDALAIRDEVGFVQAVRGSLVKSTVREERAAYELEAAIGQIVAKAIIPEGVIDIFAEAGLKRPDISLLSDEFLGPEYHAAKVKSPLEFLASTARALEVPVGTNGQLGRVLRQLGAPLYGASPPTGYPDTAEEWTSANAILARMNAGSQLANAALGGGRGFGAQGGASGDAANRAARRGPTGRAGRARGPAGTVDERTAALLERILPGGASDDTRQKIVAWGESQEQTPGNAEIATLILGSPEFQRR